MHLKLTDAEYVAKFANAVRGEDENLIWQALEVAGFSVEDMLSVVNVVPHYIDAILNNEDIQAETAFATPFKDGALQFMEAQQYARDRKCRKLYSR